MFQKPISYLKFLIKSTNQHGVHSPFVYNLVTKCFYTEHGGTEPLFQKRNISKKKEKFINKIVNYLKPENRAFKIGSYQNALDDTTSPFEMIYIEKNELEQVTTGDIEKVLKRVRNDSFMVLDAIHFSKKTEQAWENIKNHQKTSVSIDLYNLGLVFFRSGQAKEHFVIRV